MAATSTPTDYVLGHSLHEQERLMLQGRTLRPYTERFFRAAGIGPGMSLLDLGSGMGDVSLLAADLVGPCGHILGLDRDPTVLVRARQRTLEQGCSSWVSFQETGLDDFSTTTRFDAIVGRFVLLYQPNPAATLARLLHFLKPGGIVAFHEMDFEFFNATYPACPLWDESAALIPEVFRRAGIPPDFGRHLGRTFLDAGLPFPTIAAESPVGGGCGSHLYAWFAGTVESLSPRFAALGLTPPANAEPYNTLAARLEQAVLAFGSQVTGPMQFGAWSRKPL